MSKSKTIIGAFVILLGFAVFLLAQSSGGNHSGGGSGSGTVSPNSGSAGALAGYAAAGGSTTVSPFSLVYTAPELDISSATNGNGILGLSGNTSGICHQTVDATATTITDDCKRLLPSGAAGAPSLLLGSSATGLWQVTSGILGAQYAASNGGAGGWRFYAGSTVESVIQNDSSANTTFMAEPANGTMNISGGQTTATSGASVNLTNNGAGNGNFAATSGTQTAVGIGVLNNGIGQVTFAPASGTANFVALNVHPTINQTSTSSGNYTGLLVNVIGTSLKGSANKLLDLQSGATGGTSQFSISNTGMITVPSTNTATTVGTAGAASAPPATPTGYLIINVNGTNVKLPYYAN